MGDHGADGATAAARVLCSHCSERNNNKHSRLWPKPTNWMIPAKYLDFYIEKILEYEMKFKKYYSHGAVCPKLLTIFDSIVEIIIDEFNFLSNAKSKMYSY